MPAARKDRLSTVIKEVESAAKRLRNEIRKRANPMQLQKNLQDAATQLRKRAAQAAGQVEKYVQSIRKELERGTATSKARAPRSAKRRRRTTTRRKAKA
jgi:hypothetical protein